MEMNRRELEFENQRLEQTILLAKQQLSKAIKAKACGQEEIISLERDLQENTSSSLANLSVSQDFEDLVEVSQFAAPIRRKAADLETIQKRIVALERAARSPYFARIDFQFQDEAEYEKIYIGKTTLAKEHSFEMQVYDWRSPIAGMFYRFVTGPAFYDAPMGRITGEIALKRQYEIKNGKLDYYFDADLQIADEFLRRILSQNTSSKMKAIVETIQKEQDLVIRDMENELVMVQGVAGSGKTSIALHRAAYLMYQGLSNRLSAGSIMILSPNPIFEQYIANVLPELGEENVVSVVFDDLLKQILHTKRMQTKNQFLESIMEDDAERELRKRSKDFKTSPQFVELLNRFLADLPHRWIAFSDIFYDGQCIITKETLKSRFLSAGEWTPLRLRLKQLADFILESVKALHQEQGNQSEYLRVKQEAEKQTALDVVALYQSLIREETYFCHLAEGLKLPDRVPEILAFTRENLRAGTICFDDAAVLAFLELRINGADTYKMIKQVVVDEAQDYDALHFEIFHLLFPHAKYTVLGDMDQTLEKQKDLSLYQQIQRILNKKKSALITLNQSFRCTNEILHYSAKFLSHGMDVRSFNREGETPRFHIADGPKVLRNLLADEIQTCLKAGYQSIGLICKTNKNALSLYHGLKDKLEIQVIKNESSVEMKGVFLIPVYLSKGLEFDAVLLCDASQENYSTEDDKKLLYIACSRALHRLNLFCQGAPSPLL